MSGGCALPNHSGHSLYARCPDTRKKPSSLCLLFSQVFHAEPGKGVVLLPIASAYEVASKRRIPPPAFGPLPAKGS